MSQVVSVAGCTKSYGGVTALAGIDLSVERGEMFALVGPDGAGKSTLLRILAGVIDQDAGELFVLGHELPRGRSAVRMDSGYLSQSFSLYGDLSVDENLEFFAEIYRVRSFHERREELLAFTRLREFRKRRAGRLSGGMKKKLALACALIHRPKLILLDEPTTGVDPLSRRDFWLILGELLREQLTVIVATPYLEEAERCGRVGLLDHGRFLTVGTPDELKRAVEGKIFEVASREPRRDRRKLEAASEPALREVQSYGDRIHLRVSAETGEDEVRRLLREHRVEPSSVTARPATLENLFISLVREGRKK